MQPGASVAGAMPRQADTAGHPSWPALVLAGLTLLLFAWNVQHWFFLCDDAYISFRYAWNLVQGHGLTWNVGEPPIEGYTNFLWVLLMAAGLAIGVSPEILSPILGIASGAGILFLLVRFSASRLGWRDPLTWGAPLLLSCSRSFTAWCTGGLETQFFAFLVFAGALAYLRERRDSARWPVVSAVLLASATLTRPEGALFTAVIGVLFAADLAGRRRTVRSAVNWAAAWWVICGAHLAWRAWYYGALLPNTFHAKVNGLWLEQGMAYLSVFQEDYHVAWYAWLILVPLFWKREHVHVLFFSCAAAHVAYVASVGGDRFEFRFLVTVFPMFYWQLVEGLRILVQRLIDENRAWRTARIAAMSVVLLLCVITSAGSRETRDTYRKQVAAVHHMRDRTKLRAEQGRLLRKFVEDGLLPKDLRICTRGAGALPYFSRLHTLDFMGLSDPRVVTEELAERTVVAHEHKASAAHLANERIALFDVNRTVVYDRFDNPAVELRKAREGVRELNDGKAILSAKCRTAGEFFLVYATTLSDSEDERLFTRLPKCDVDSQ